MENSSALRTKALRAVSEGFTCELLSVPILNWYFILPVLLLTILFLLNVMSGQHNCRS